MPGILKYIWKEITRAMPLDKFGDYNEYWERRDDFDSTSDAYPPLHRAKLISKNIEPDSTILDIGFGNSRACNRH